MKYEIGEKIIIRSDLHMGDDYYIHVSHEMELYRGKEGTIVKCVDYNDVVMYDIKFDGSDVDSFWYWTDDMFIPINLLSDIGVKYRLKIQTETRLGVLKGWTAFVASSKDVTEIINGVQEHGDFKSVKYEVDELEIDKPLDVINAVCGICL